MRSTALIRLGLIVGLGLLTACGGGGDDEIYSPAGRGSGVGGGSSSGDGAGGDDSAGGSGPGVVKIGSGTGANFAQGALAASETNLTAGGTTDIVVNLVDDTNSAISDELEVSFSSDCASNGLASFNPPAATTASGRATVKYTAAGCSGLDKVTAKAAVDGSTIQASVDLTIEADRVTALKFVEANPAQLTLKGMGGNENSAVSFQLVGEQGTPMRNELITFSLSTAAGGVTLIPDSDGDPSSETVKSGVDGVATITVRSGTVADTVHVTASYDGGRIQSRSGDLVISTGVPTYDQFSLSFKPHAPANAYSVDGIAVEVQIIASDQFGNDAFDGTQIRFWSRESGNIDNSCELVSGRCTVDWISSSPRPADGRATFIAFTNGAEVFTDKDGDFVFDAGEDWTDLSEAYADHNENGQYDVGEPFVDTRGASGAWDSASDVGGNWDGPCVSDYCPGESSVTVWKTGVIILPDPNPEIFRQGPDAAGCSTRITPITPEEKTIIDASGGFIFPAFFVSDGTPRDALPCHIIGNPMSAGTTIAFSTDNGKIIGNSSWTVPENATEATIAGPLEIKPDTTPSDGTLTLTITPADTDVSPSIYTWTLID